jgi:hypothetical protein
MDRSRETGRYLDAQRRPLAEAVVARQYQLQPELPDRYGEAGRAKCVQDTEYHLAYLAAAVTFASPALFAEYVAWAKPVLAAHGVGPDDVERNPSCCMRTTWQEWGKGGETLVFMGPNRGVATLRPPSQDFTASELFIG